MKKIQIPELILHKLLRMLVASTILAGIFLFTDPNNVPLALLPVPFVLVGYLLYSFVMVGMYMGNKKSSLSSGRLVAMSVALCGVLLLLLASLGQLTVKDGLLVIGFIGVFVFYVRRVDFLNNNRS